MRAPTGRARIRGVRVAWQELTTNDRRHEADALVAQVAAEMSPGRAPISVARECTHCGASDHGRPILTGGTLCASISYAANAVVVALADSARVSALGIDAEHRSAAGALALTGMVTPGRHTSLRAWTRIEAVLKANGTGLRIEPQLVRIERSLWRIHGGVDRDDASLPRTPARLRRVFGPRELVISLAVVSARQQVETRQGRPREPSHEKLRER